MPDSIDSLKKEEKQKQNNPLKVKSNPLLEESVKLFEFGINVFGLIQSDMIGEFYTKITPQKYYANDLSAFIMLVKSYENELNFQEHLGYYLSYLICRCNESRINLDTKCLTELPDYLTLWTDKELIIEGNAGNYLGYSMQRGKIILNGNAGYYVGCIMKNGIINILGNVGNNLGEGMIGGQIELFGDCITKDKCQNLGGKIYHKGIRIDV